MSPIARNLPSVRTRLSHNVTSPQEMKAYSEGSRTKRTESSNRNSERPGARERVDDLEASIDVIDGLVTSLSDFAMRSQVSHSNCVHNYFCQNRVKIRNAFHPGFHIGAFVGYL